MAPSGSWIHTVACGSQRHISRNPARTLLSRRRERESAEYLNPLLQRKTNTNARSADALSCLILMVVATVGAKDITAAARHHQCLSISMPRAHLLLVLAHAVYQRLARRRHCVGDGFDPRGEDVRPFIARAFVVLPAPTRVPLTRATADAHATYGIPAQRAVMRVSPSCSLTCSTGSAKNQSRSGAR